MHQKNMKSKAGLQFIQNTLNLFVFFISLFTFYIGFSTLQAAAIELEDVIQFEVSSIRTQDNLIQIKLITKDNFKIYKDNLSFELRAADAFPEYLAYQTKPKEKLVFDSFSNTKKYIFENGTMFAFTTSTQLQNNSKIIIAVQGCSNTVCLLPAQLEVATIPHAISVAVKKSHLFTETKPETTALSHEVTKTQELRTKQESTKPPKNFNLSAHSIERSLSNITENLFKTGGILLFPLLLLAGLLTNLTPCVYPMIPITIGVMNRFTERKNSKFRLAFAYFLGMVITYSVLGVLAAMTGKVFGSQLGSPVFSLIVAGIMILLGFAMLDFFDLSFLQRLSNKMPFAEKNPVLALSTMGALSGLVAAPCTGPILSMILVLIAQTRNPFNGFIYMLCFSIGFGAPYLLLGVVSQKLTQMPKLHRVSIVIKLIFACLMFSLAFYFLKGLLKDFVFLNFLYTKPDLSDVIAVLILLLLSIGIKHPKFQAFAKFAHFGIVVLLTLLSLWFTLWVSDAFVISRKHKPSHEFEDLVKNSKIHWETDLKFASVKAIQQNKKVLVDVWAEWCAACLEMENTTWKDQNIVDLIEKKFIPVKLDYTHPTETISDQLTAWKIVGLPAVLILDPKQDNKTLEVNQGIIVTKDLLQKLSNY
jgi:thiol:disulfide interchange protein DsbD